MRPLIGSGVNVQSWDCLTRTSLPSWSVCILFYVYLCQSLKMTRLGNGTGLSLSYQSALRGSGISGVLGTCTCRTLVCVHRRRLFWIHINLPSSVSGNHLVRIGMFVCADRLIYSMSTYGLLSHAEATMRGIGVKISLPTCRTRRLIAQSISTMLRSSNL